MRFRNMSGYGIRVSRSRQRSPKEFEAIIAVVIGGALLTGGYGSVVGAALGALIFGVVQQGLFFAGVESSLFRVFLGVLLLAAVILNTYIRRIITGEK